MRIFSLLGHRALAPVWVLLAAALVLLPGLSRSGLWEPQEIEVADDAIGRVKQGDEPGGRPEKTPEATPDCPRRPADDDGARTLTPQLAAAGIAAFGTRIEIEAADGTIERDYRVSESALRVLVALLGLLGVLATYGIAARLGNPRAGLIAAAILLSFPLLVLQSRMLTSELGSAVGGALIVYGLIGVARPARRPWLVLDLLVSLVALVIGVGVGYLGGGLLLGVVPGLAAVAVAGGLGLPLLGPGVRCTGQLGLRALAVVRPTAAVGRRRPIAVAAGIGGRDALLAAAGGLALLGLIGCAIVLGHEIYDVQDRAPGTREILGKSFVPRECWSDTLGGIWRARDDGRSTYDSLFEQIAFGTFPWGVLAPLALGGLALGLFGAERRQAGWLTLAWAGAAWLAASIFDRKVGFNIYAGFPAMAIALGLALDSFLTARRAHDADPAGAGGRRLHTTGLLIGLWALAGMIALGKDLSAFPDKLASLLIDQEAFKDEEKAKLLGRFGRWPLRLALLQALALVWWAWAWWPRQSPRWRWLNRYGTIALAAAMAITVGIGLFWAQVWQPRLARMQSSKSLFSAYREHRGEGDVLGIMGDMGNAPRYYAGGPWRDLGSNSELKRLLAEEPGAFALVPARERCAIHRDLGGQPYTVVDDSNANYLLITNKEGFRDRNALSRQVMREAPEVGTAFDAAFDDRIELIGYTMPAKVELGSRFQMTLFFHVKKKVSGAWKIFVHFDGQGSRFQGDHEPLGGTCDTRYWNEGDYIVDTFTVEAGNVTYDPGNYAARVGFWQGSAPNYKNMKVTRAPQGTKDDADRVLIGSIKVE